jgi:hypothetical protein
MHYAGKPSLYSLYRVAGYHIYWDHHGREVLAWRQMLRIDGSKFSR